MAILALLFSLAGTAWAQLSLDPGFGLGGQVSTSIDSFTQEGAGAMVVDSQDRVLIAYAGFNSQGVSRHNPDGTLDAGFASDGVAALDFAPTDLVLQPDGRVVVVGTRRSGDFTTEDWQVLRLLQDGSVDTSFGTMGLVSIDFSGSSDGANSVALNSNGDIVVGGRAFIDGFGTAFAVAQLDTNGVVQFQRSDKLVSGTADICMEVLVQADGRIICVGLVRNFATAIMVVVRYETDFELDTSFGTGGVAQIDFGGNAVEANSAVLQPNGSIIVGGFVDSGNDRNLALARLTATGELDSNFGNNGRVERPLTGDTSETIQDMLIFQDDLYVAASTFETESYALLAFSADGTQISSFANNGLALVNFNGRSDFARTLVVHQGALLIGGTATAESRTEGGNIGLARFTTGGILDAGFANAGLREVSLSGPVNARALAALHQSDGKVVAAGYVGSSFSDRNFAVARYLPDGSLDSDFGNQGLVVTDFNDGEDSANAIAIQPDGRLLVAGNAELSPETEADFAIARYLADGTLDSSFGQNGLATIDIDGRDDVARAVHLLADGRILLAGNGFFADAGSPRQMTVIRLQSNGVLDTNFANNGVANVPIGSFDEGHALAVQMDGSIIVGGIGDADFAMIRFLQDGMLDSSFGSAGIVSLDFAGEFDFMRDLRIIPNWNGQGERILAVGSARSGSSAASSDFAAALFRLDGSLETGFGSNGMVTEDLMPGERDEATSVALMGDRIVLAGFSFMQGVSDFAILGLTITGQADPIFTSTGATAFADFFASVDEANAITVTSAGEITLVGYVFNPSLGNSGQQFGLARFADIESIFRDGFEG
ncbi:MAG: hypothetical protein AAF446_00810 [Pseudomonadota bacterium]